MSLGIDYILFHRHWNSLERAGADDSGEMTSWQRGAFKGTFFDFVCGYRIKSVVDRPNPFWGFRHDEVQVMDLGTLALPLGPFPPRDGSVFVMNIEIYSPKTVRTHEKQWEGILLRGRPSYRVCFANCPIGHGRT